MDIWIENTTVEQIQALLTEKRSTTPAIRSLYCLLKGGPVTLGLLGCKEVIEQIRDGKFELRGDHYIFR